MSFSKAKLKRFNDVDVLCGSPAAGNSTSTTSSGSLNSVGTTSTTTPTTAATATSAQAPPPERKEQIEKFFKDAVRFASSSKESKDFAIPKEDKKSKGLRLFRTPSLPQRLRFRPAAQTSHHSEASSGASTAASTPLHSAATTPIKEAKSANRLKGKEALQQEIRSKNELIESYLSQLDVLRRHVEQLKETEAKMREEHECALAKTDQLVQALTSENREQKELNEQLSAENTRLLEHCSGLDAQLQQLREQHESEVHELTQTTLLLTSQNEQLRGEAEEQLQTQQKLHVQLLSLQADLEQSRSHCEQEKEKTAANLELVENLKNSNDSLLNDVTQLKEQIEQDALSYAQEMKVTQTELECLRLERNTLKNDLANKCTLIRSLQDELLDKNCEIDAHCDTIRQLCREKAKYVEQERVEEQAAAKMQQLESDLESAIEREKSYWRAELDKRQKLAENEIIKIELEKQDVMILLETTNDMLRERDEKLQKYEEQLRNGVDYYIQLTDTLQKQVVDLKQDMAKTITEKYNYQLTLNNTRSTVNILMERLKKSDADVEQFKAELESVQLAKGALEQSYLTLQADAEQLRQQLSNSEAALTTLRNSSEQLQSEVSLKESMLHQILSSEAETLAKFNKIANSFQARIDTDADVARYYELYSELKRKDDTRELYMADMKKALDEFATVLQFAQLELDNKEQTLLKVREECEQLKLENITLKSKQLDGIALTPSKAANKPNTTDLEKIEDMLIDSELRAECDKITSWLLNSSEKCVRQDSSNEFCELLSKPVTPNKARTPKAATPKAITPKAVTPRTPRTPRTPKTTQTTPKKTLLFAATGKENVPSPPPKPVLKARNV